jgi:hypothetical protein
LFCKEHGYFALAFLARRIIFVFQEELPIEFAKLGQSEEGHPKRGYFDVSSNRGTYQYSLADA